jgi:hypothetical protein
MHTFELDAALAQMSSDVSPGQASLGNALLGFDLVY